MWRSTMKVLPLARGAGAGAPKSTTVFGKSMIFHRSLNIYQIFSKEALAKERERLSDELNRGYFSDIADLRKHGGKRLMTHYLTLFVCLGHYFWRGPLASGMHPLFSGIFLVILANENLIPSASAKNFPLVAAEFADGRKVSLPKGHENVVNFSERNEMITQQHVTLLCLTFRASGQPMTDTWISAFLKTFKSRTDIQLYQVHFIDRWLISCFPIKQLLLWTMSKSKSTVDSDGLKKQVAYSFGDHYYFRKELNIVNLLTGYLYLLDKKGKIRWQGSGTASIPEISSLISCTSSLLKEQSNKP